MQEESRPRNRFQKGNKFGVHNGAPVKSEGPDILYDANYIPRVGFERLCCAIVVQAAKDRAWWFFESEAIKLYLTSRIDPVALMKQIKENYKQFGRWSATDTKAESWITKPQKEVL